VDDSEVLAKQCFDVLRAPQWLEYQEQQSCGEADFVIRDGESGTIGVLEATTAHDPVYQETLSNLTPDRQTVPISGCSKPWRVWPRGDARINKIRSDLDAVLQGLETRGITEFDMTSAQPECVDVMTRLGLQMGRQLEGSCDAHVIHLPDHSGHLDEKTLGGVIRYAASRQDNLRKLSVPALRERHLFIRVDLTSIAAHYVLGERVQHKPVSVNEAITHLWLARHTSAVSAVVLYARNGGEWMRQEVRVAGSAGV